MKKFNFKIRGNKYNVEIEKVKDRIIEIDVNGSKYKVELEQDVNITKTPVLKRTAVSTHKKIEKKVSSATLLVKSPLPGNILQVFVKEGDEVKKGDKLVMYEAMKMENIILAERAGTVQNLKVKVGDTVLQEEQILEIV